MFPILLRPQILSFKNRLLHKERSSGLFNREVTVIALSILLVFAIYWGTCGFLVKLQSHEQFSPVLIARILSLSFLSFFWLLLFSNSVTALGFFFGSNDLPLILTSPISAWELYVARLIQTAVSSGWMFLMFFLPAAMAMSDVFNLPVLFIVFAVLVCLPFLIIPAACASLFVTLFVNIFPADRIKDLVITLAFLGVVVLIYIGHSSNLDISMDKNRLDILVSSMLSVKDPNPFWLPSRWAADILSGFLSNTPGDLLSRWALLLGVTGISMLVGYLAFARLFFRGWGLITRSNRVHESHGSKAGELFSRLVFPFRPQMRAVMLKEFSIFVRDASQSLQMIILLMLTFVYLYNFRALRAISIFSDEAYSWWQAVLALANIALGGCVVSAICTRFVYPAISLEGPSYSMIRFTPLSIKQIVRYKFFTWYIPISLVAVVLLVSGAWAVQAPVETVVLSAITAIALSAGIVGLGIGVGAVYVKFDWESPTQVTASFGSLVYMFLAFAVSMITMIPVSFLCVISCVPNFAEQIRHSDLLFAQGCAYFLIFFVNIAAAKRALRAGCESLAELER